MTLLAITLAAPWSFAVVVLGKRIENRTWTDSRLEGGAYVAIHGGKTPPPGHSFKRKAMNADVEWLATTPAWREHVGRRIEMQDYEGIVAVCKIGRVLKPNLEIHIGEQQVWRQMNQYAWELTELEILPEPVKCSGKQGLWPVTGATLEQVREQVKRGRRAELEAGAL